MGFHIKWDVKLFLLYIVIAGAYTSIRNHLKGIFIGVYIFIYFLLCVLSYLLFSAKSPSVCRESYCEVTVPKIRNKHSQKWNCEASFPIRKFMYLWAVCTFLRSIHLFRCSKIRGPMMEIYKSLTDTWMWKLGTRPRNFFLGIQESDLVRRANERPSLRQANNLAAGMTAHHNYHWNYYHIYCYYYCHNIAPALHEKPENLTEKPSTISK